MFGEKPINAAGKIFSKHGYIMATAQLDSHRSYYADIRQLLNGGFVEKIKWGYIIGQKLMADRKLRLSAVCSPMRCFVWKLPSFIISTATAILPSGILRLIRMSPEAVQTLVIHLQRRIGLSRL